MIKRAPKPRDNFQILRNEVARDRRLSYRASGILAEILSRPDDWSVSAERLVAARDSTEGLKAIRTALTELERAGYLVRRRIRSPGGRFVWIQVIRDVAEVSPGDITAGGTISPSATHGSSTDGGPLDGKGSSLEEPIPRTDKEDEVECPASGRFAPSGGANANEDHLDASDDEPDDTSGAFVDWREEDMDLFRSVVGDQMATDGRRWSPVGVHAAWVWYDAFRKDKRKPLDWPGRYLEQLAERGQLEEWLGRRGITLVE